MYTMVMIFADHSFISYIGVGFVLIEYILWGWASYDGKISMLR